MLTRFWRWFVGGPRPHDWTPWEAREEKIVGLAAAFGGLPTMVQSRFCKRCGFRQECSLSTHREVDCEETA